MRADTQSSKAFVYTDYHPRWLRQHMSHLLVAREAGVFRVHPARAHVPVRRLVCVYLLLLTQAVIDGPAAYAQFMAWSASPWMILLNVVSFALLVFHAITFFDAAPQALIVHLGSHAGCREQLVLIGSLRRHWVGAARVGSSSGCSVRADDDQDDIRNRCCGCSSAPAACCRACSCRRCS